MTIDIEEEVAELRGSENEDDLFHKVREQEKGFIAEIEKAEKREDREAIKKGIDKLMTFYKRALEIATLDVTRDRIIAWIRLWKSHAFRNDIEIEPITRFPLSVHPLESQELKPKPEKYAGRTGLGKLGQYPREIGGTDITEMLERSREKLGELWIEKTFPLSLSPPVMAHLKRTIKGYTCHSTTQKRKLGEMAHPKRTIKGYSCHSTTQKRKLGEMAHPKRTIKGYGIESKEVYGTEHRVLLGKEGTLFGNDI